MGLPGDTTFVLFHFSIMNVIFFLQEVLEIEKKRVIKEFESNYRYNKIFFVLFKTHLVMFLFAG